MNGILNLLKPPGMTSSDAVVRVRKKLGGKRSGIKVGHGGTLDPDAAGVLPILVGKGTRLFDYLQTQTKVYTGEFVLGYATDTLDTSGKLLQTHRVTDAMIAGLPAVMALWRGVVEQAPPLYSAIKQGGQKLYQIARKGGEAKVAPRKVRIDAFELLEQVDATHFRFLLRCGKGTYVRALVRDVGDALGCGACLASLVRTQSGDFDIRDAVTLPQVDDAPLPAFQAMLRPMDQALRHLPAVYMPATTFGALRDGKSVAVSQERDIPSDIFRLYCGDVLMGVASSTEEGVRVITWLYDAREE